MGGGITHGEASNFWSEQLASQRDKKLDAAKSIAEANAGDAALRALAETQYAAAGFDHDAQRWGLEVFMREVWTRAYQQGWRDAHFRMFIQDPPEEA